MRTLRTLSLAALVVALNACPGPDPIEDVGTNPTDAGARDVGTQAGEDAAAPGIDAAIAPDSGSEAVDGGVAEVDSGMLLPDAATPGGDAATPGGDAATPGVDAAAPGVDAAAPGVDAAAPGVDAATPGVDAAAPGVDAAAPGVDAATPGVDAGAPIFLDAGSADAGPGPGEYGGACAPGDTCQVKTCQDLGGTYGKVCTEACLSNYGCPDSLRCEATSSYEMFCLWGPRGTGGIGAPCGSAGEKGLGCQSGICIDADSLQIPVDTCTEPCATDAECSSPFPVCLTWYGLCVPIPSGELGGICRASGPCFEGTCLDVPGLGQRCTQTCTQTSECGQPWLECRAAGTSQYCLLKP